MNCCTELTAKGPAVARVLTDLFVPVANAGQAVATVNGQPPVRQAHARVRLDRPRFH